VIDSELKRTTEDYPFPPKEIDRLRERRWILGFAKEWGVGAEVGVFRGHFAEVLIDALVPTKIYLIDPWTKQGEFFNWAAKSSPYTSGNRLPTAVAKREAELRAARFVGVNVKVVEGYFGEETGRIEEKLDWIYIDANHGFHQALEDLHAARGLMKDDGVIMGDDWQPDPRHKHHGVFRAVQKFTRTTNYRIVAAGPAGQYCLAPAPVYGARGAGAPMARASTQ